MVHRIEKRIYRAQLDESVKNSRTELRIYRFASWANIRQVKIHEKLTLLSNIAFNCLNNALESRPRSVRCNIWVPTTWVWRSQRVRFGNTLYRLTTLAAIALQGVTCPPLFPNRRNSIQSIWMLIVRPNLIEMANDLDNGGIPPRIQLEVHWRLDVDKQKWVLMMLDNKSNREVDRFSRVWNGPLGTDIIAFGRRELIV